MLAAERRRRRLNLLFGGETGSSSLVEFVVYGCGIDVSSRRSSGDQLNRVPFEVFAKVNRQLRLHKKNHTASTIKTQFITGQTEGQEEDAEILKNNLSYSLRGE